MRDSPATDTILQIIHPSCPPTPRAVAQRRALRGIALRGSSIPLLKTRRYDHFSVPAGEVLRRAETSMGTSIVR